MAAISAPRVMDLWLSAAVVLFAPAANAQGNGHRGQEDADRPQDVMIKNHQKTLSTGKGYDQISVGRKTSVTASCPVALLNQRSLPVRRQRCHTEALSAAVIGHKLHRRRICD